ncbi:HAMP domain-containing sensor histidine kinase [Niabella yanshanensis]|uniref:histidine kinase n=1 Tax=Niabella yanshanensis TaxID=577386 RepID=A0ABZ0W8F3_9BACT|nr:HAMP domain-containing sensor histidine kinase [Niabella yanshanensis]WQD38772.1 HAMP domain-containing sensor histidine kinase [Niabella yanshanensis]
MILFWLTLLLLVTVLIAFLIYQYRQLQLARVRIRLLEALESEKDKLFTVIGHDLNGFVNMGHAGLQLYRLGNLTQDDKQALLDELEEKFYTASVTLQSLLNWGKSLFKGLTINPGVFDGTELIEAELNLAKATIKNKAIRVINKMPVPQPVYTDMDHFKFIIRNLVSNAVKFSRTAGAITIGTIDKGQEGFVVIVVTDSGIGMAKEKLKQVFFPFGPSTEGTAKEKGNGIGLMLCREYARQNGGELWAESRDGAGTSFYYAVKVHLHHLKYPVRLD